MGAATRHSPEDVVPGSLRAWGVASRPKTLWIAAIPVAVATGLAYLDGAPILGWVTALALAGSLVVQVLSNLQNDVGYTARGLEKGSRTGLPRATARGWLTPEEVRRAIVAATGAALVVGAPLVMRGGWPVLAIGLASLVAALAYMGGPRPIAYTALGELTVFGFFGLAAVLGTYYLHAGRPGLTAWLGAAATGLHAAAVLAVNNHRDAEHDRLTGRSTFAARFGAAASARLFAFALWTPFALAAAMAALASSPGLALPLVLVPVAMRLGGDFARSPGGAAYNELLFRAVKLELAFGAALSLGAVAQRLLQGA